MLLLMKIVFHLEFLKLSRKHSHSFKSGAAYELFEDYCDRISKYMDCQISGSLEREMKNGLGQDEIWFCDRGLKAVVSSSEDIAARLKSSLNRTPKTLRIVIGGPDGFAKETFAKFPQAFRWSFGPMTLPHELAAVVASEQFYRAFTIIKNAPYHLGH